MQLNKVAIAGATGVRLDFNQTIKAPRTPNLLAGREKVEQQIGQTTKKAIKTIEFSKTALTLSAGMMMSNIVHEAWMDPNIRACWSSITNPVERSPDTMDQCDRAYADWHATVYSLGSLTSVGAIFKWVIDERHPPMNRKMAKWIVGLTAFALLYSGIDDWGRMGQWVPDLITLSLAGYLSAGTTKIIGAIIGGGIGKGFRTLPEQTAKKISEKIAMLKRFGAKTVSMLRLTTPLGLFTKGSFSLVHFVMFLGLERISSSFECKTEKQISGRGYY